MTAAVTVTVTVTGMDDGDGDEDVPMIFCGSLFLTLTSTCWTVFLDKGVQS